MNTPTLPFSQQINRKWERVPYHTYGGCNFAIISYPEIQAS